MRYTFKAIFAAIFACVLAAGLYVACSFSSIMFNMTASPNAMALAQIPAGAAPAASDSVAPAAPTYSDTLPEDFYIMLLGVDSSENRKNGDEAELYEGDAFRSDTIMLAHVNTNTKKISLCSFHRDIETDIDGYGPGYKLNAAYALGGAPLMQRELEELTGLKSGDIPYYAIVDMDGLRSIIDSVGGVEVDVEAPFHDDFLNDGIDKAGVQNLNGEKALVYARSRHAWDDMGYGDGDRVRARHQRDVLKALAKKFSGQDMFSLLNSAETISHFVSTNLSASQIFELAGKMHDINAERDIYSMMTPTTSDYIDETYYENIDEAQWKYVLKDLKSNTGVTATDETEV